VASIAKRLHPGRGVRLFLLDSSHCAGLGGSRRRRKWSKDLVGGGRVFHGPSERAAWTFSRHRSPARGREPGPRSRHALYQTLHRVRNRHVDGKRSTAATLAAALRALEAALPGRPSSGDHAVIYSDRGGHGEAAERSGGHRRGMARAFGGRECPRSRRLHGGRRARPSRDMPWTSAGASTRPGMRCAVAETQLPRRLCEARLCAGKIGVERGADRRCWASRLAQYIRG